MRFEELLDLKVENKCELFLNLSKYALEWESKGDGYYTCTEGKDIYSISVKDKKMYYSLYQKKMTEQYNSYIPKFAHTFFHDWLKKNVNEKDFLAVYFTKNIDESVFFINEKGKTSGPDEIDAYFVQYPFYTEDGLTLKSAKKYTSYGCNALVKNLVKNGFDLRFGVFLKICTVMDDNNIIKFMTSFEQEYPNTTVDLQKDEHIEKILTFIEKTQSAPETIVYRILKGLNGYEFVNGEGFSKKEHAVGLYYQEAYQIIMEKVKWNSKYFKLINTDLFTKKERDKKIKENPDLLKVVDENIVGTLNQSDMEIAVKHHVSLLENIDFTQFLNFQRENIESISNDYVKKERSAKAVPIIEKILSNELCASLLNEESFTVCMKKAPILKLKPLLLAAKHTSFNIENLLISHLTSGNKSEKREDIELACKDYQNIYEPLSYYKLEFKEESDLPDWRTDKTVFVKIIATKKKTRKDSTQSLNPQKKQTTTFVASKSKPSNLGKPEKKVASDKKEKDKKTDERKHPLIEEKNKVTSLIKSKEQAKSMSDIENRKIHYHKYKTNSFPATCSNYGYQVHTCEICNDTYEEYTHSPVGHDWDDGVIKKQPSCINNGWKVFTCQRCSVKKEKLLPAIGHEFEENIIAPTCETYGYTLSLCKNCKKEYRRNLTKPLGHQYHSEIVQPTCNKEGYTSHICKNCGKERRTDITPKLNHLWGEGIIVSEPTCEKDGVLKHECKLCKEIKTEKIKALSHDYKETVVSATCEKDGYTEHTCKRCKKAYKNKNTKATGHSWSEGVVIKKPECTKEGERELACDSCGLKRVEKLHATGHDYEKKLVQPSCTERGYTLHICKACNHEYKDDYEENTGHMWENETIIREATETEEGIRTYTCSKCDVIKEETIPIMLSKAETYTQKDLSSIPLDELFHV